VDFGDAQLRQSHRQMICDSVLRYLLV